MTTKCIGLMGRIFGHKWRKKCQYWRVKRITYFRHYLKCKRCGCKITDLRDSSR
jgi:hypothetical protein